MSLMRETQKQNINLQKNGQGVWRSWETRKALYFPRSICYLSFIMQLGCLLLSYNSHRPMMKNIFLNGRTGMEVDLEYASYAWTSVSNNTIFKKKIYIRLESKPKVDGNHNHGWYRKISGWKKPCLLTKDSLFIPTPQLDWRKIFPAWIQCSISTLYIITL